MKRINLIITILLLVISVSILWAKDIDEIKLSAKEVFVENEEFDYQIMDMKENKVLTQSKIVCKIDDDELEITDSANRSKIVVNKTTLEPKNGKVVIEYNGTYNIDTRFSEDSIYIDASTPQGDQSMVVEKPEGILLHNDQILMSLRAMDFTKEKQKTIIFVPANGKTMDLVLVVGEKENFEVPAGKFEVYPVTLDFGVATQTAYYEVESPHRMIAYDNGTIQYQLK